MREPTVKERILADPGLIPSLPDVVTEALRLVDQPGVSPDDFEEVLSKDPPLVASMLKIANSPVYGFAHEKETIRDAIIGIGLNGLHAILMASTLKRFLGRQFTCYDEDPRMLWHHAMAVANASKVLTGELSESLHNAEEMFVAGLLHDLGKLLLAPFLMRMGRDLSGTSEPVHVVEERLLGIDHQDAGGIIAERWNMKPLVQAVIEHHHSSASPDGFRHAIAVVRLADQWAKAHGRGTGASDDASTQLPEDLEVVGLQPSEWEDVQATLSDDVRVGT